MLIKGGGVVCRGVTCGGIACRGITCGEGRWGKSYTRRRSSGGVPAEAWVAVIGLRRPHSLYAEALHAEVLHAERLHADGLHAEGLHG